MQHGIYEEIITKMVKEQLAKITPGTTFVKTDDIDREEASHLLTMHLSRLIRWALDRYSGKDEIADKLAFANKLVQWIKNELEHIDFEEGYESIEGKLLKGIFSQIDTNIVDYDRYLKEITPYSRLIYSELFTGGAQRISLESELNKEIRSSDRIDFLVSFIKFSGLRLILPSLRDFAENGGKLRVITTTYVGATDAKAVDVLSKLPNTEVKVSYNTKSERVHAKAYLFYRNTGFHTGYIGSSNFSRSALTDGLEWNIKITTKEIGHVIDKFQKTFETYWNSPDFERYDFNETKAGEKLRRALNTANTKSRFTTYFDFKPHPYQEEILEKLAVEREIHQRNRNLLVAATGTGKTMIAAFDFKRIRAENPSARLLFIAHRKEILEQAQDTFRAVLKDHNFGSFWADGNEPGSYSEVFASVQTLNNRLESFSNTHSKEYYDVVIFDEVHHIQANSYRKILDYFKPKVLLGLTATPERMDGKDIVQDFGGRISAEIRLPEALKKGLLSPFHYFGVSDAVDISKVKWSSGRYDVNELTRIYTGNDIRLSCILHNLDTYLTDPQDARALGFCVSQVHAEHMAKKFNENGLKADYLVSKNASKREELRDRFRKKEINYLFVVDIFNEGVDIPEIDTVLFLRPTESLTIFLQQLGRGLRLHEGKLCLTVLDFVSNARDEYDFEGKFRALIGKSNNSVKKEIQDNFPHLPSGCSIQLEKKAKEHILRNIQATTSPGRAKLIQRIQNYRHQSSAKLTLETFLSFYNLSLVSVYKHGTWSELKYEAGILKQFDDVNNDQIKKAIHQKWLSTRSYSYFRFIRDLANKDFGPDFTQLSEEEKQMCLMLHYDIWRDAGGFETLEDSIRAMGANKVLNEEIAEFMQLMMDRIDFKEIGIDLPYRQPLKVHARYTRDQVLAAYGLSTFQKKSSNREGVAFNKELNTELLFINLKKSEEDFSPTTMYEDYAINEKIFHWQSQNASHPESGKGLSYIEHEKIGKRIVLFIREQSKDENGLTMGFVFAGNARFIEHSGARPMNIKWELRESIPPYLHDASVKLG